jgi:hypothetical protein
MCLTSFAVVFGFFVFNWPKGAIFLGDAGAYLIGFWVVELGILLAMRNPQISPMAPVVAGLLPLIETLFSMYRRKVVRGLPINQPDALHLHTLVYRRLLFNPQFIYTSEQLNSLNAKVAIFFWMPAAIFGFAVLYTYAGAPLYLYGTITIFIVAYVTLMIPHAVRPQLTTMMSIGKEYAEASRAHGGGVWRTLAIIQIPLARNGVAVASAMVIVMLFHEFAAVETLLTALFVYPIDTSWIG